MGWGRGPGRQPAAAACPKTAGTVRVSGSPPPRSPRSPRSSRAVTSGERARRALGGVSTGKIIMKDKKSP